MYSFRGNDRGGEGEEEIERRERHGRYRPRVYRDSRIGRSVVEHFSDIHIALYAREMTSRDVRSER